MKEGVYKDLNEQEYHLDPALGSTSIKYLLESPLQYWYHSPFNKGKKEETSEALKLGRAIHSAILEPQNFSNNFSVNRKFKKSSKSNVLGSNEFKTVNRIRNFVKQSEFKELIKNGVAETSVFWKDKDTGIMCKCRFDYLVKGSIIIDLKTIATLRKKDISNEIFNLNRRYYTQAAHYIEGLRALKEMKGLEMGNEHFYFIFVSKDAPIEMKVVKIENDILELGKEECREALKTYQECYQKFREKEWREEQPILKLSADDIPAWFNYYGGLNE
jgi:exodeoxyribonuclease VIII